MNPLSALASLEPVHWPTLVIATARTVGVMTMGPLWSAAPVPAQLRGAIAIIVTLALLPAVPHADVATASPAVIVPMMSELLLGAVIGLSAAIFLHAVSIAAEVVSLQMGLSLGAALASSPGIGSPGVGQALGNFSLTIFASLGGHVALVLALARSFQAIPPGGALALDAGGHAVVALAGGVFTTAIRIAAPVMVVLLVTNIALAIVNRAVPQLNTMMVSAPLTVAIGLITLGATLPLLLPMVTGWAAGAAGAAEQMVRAFALSPAVP